MTYANINGVESLYWFSNTEVYSYNINTAVKSSLNLQDQLSEKGISEWQYMTVYNNKLLWETYDDVIQVYDLTTRQFSTLHSNDWSNLGSETAACFNCERAFLTSSGNKMIYATIPQNINGLSTGLTFVTIESSRPNILPETSAAITSLTTYYNRASGYYYTLSPSGTFNFYQGVFLSDIAIDCKTGHYSPVNDFHILLGNEYTYFARASTNTLTIGLSTSSKYDVVPASELPRCLSPTRSTLISFTDLHTDRHYNHYNSYSSKKSDKIILFSYNDVIIYNVASNTVSPLTLTPPQAPSQSNQSPGMPPQSSQPSGHYYYPISINTEFDYWLYQDYIDDKCKLVSSIEATSVITLPSGNTTTTITNATHSKNHNHK